jgi:heme-degrading monooxygenase HmoA
LETAVVIKEKSYYAVIFTSTRTTEGEQAYQETALRMIELAKEQPGFLGVDSVREGLKGMTVSYWSDLTAIKNWKNNLEHLHAQQQGREHWYSDYKLRIAKVDSIFCGEFAFDE